MIDAVVKKNIKSLMYSEVTADYLAEEDKKHQRKNAKAKWYLVYSIQYLQKWHGKCQAISFNEKQFWLKTRSTAIGSLGRLDGRKLGYSQFFILFKC